MSSNSFIHDLLGVLAEAGGSAILTIYQIFNIICIILLSDELWWPMHALHVNDAPQAYWEGFPYRTLLPAGIGGPLSIYLLTVTHANPHAHDMEDQIYIIHSGRGIMEIGDEQQEVGPGWLVHIPHGQRHALTPLNGEPVVLYSIEYRPV